MATTGAIRRAHYYMAQLDLIYALNRKEKELYDGLLTEDDRIMFPHYLIGHKLAKHQDQHWRRYTRTSLRSHIKNWNDRARFDSVIAREHIQRGIKNPDPRLAPERYVLSPLVEAFFNRIDGHDAAMRFNVYAIGRAVATDRAPSDATLADETIQGWNEPSDASEIEEFCRIGEKWLYKATHPEPMHGSSDGHMYNADEKPYATAGDTAHMKANNPSPNGTWRFENVVYQNPSWSWNGGHCQRIVHLYARVDDDGRVLDRMAVKIQGGPQANHIRTITQKEHDVQKELQTASENILKVRGWSYRRPASNRPPHLGYLYMDWAPYGSLWNLVCRTYDANSPEDVRQIPEPMIWLIFRGLAEALHSLHTGLPIAHDRPTETESSMANSALLTRHGWQPYTNVDIKLMNVVMSHANPNWYPAYKTPLMIDFGETRRNAYPDRASKKDGNRYKHIGTRGERPPEQYRPPHPKYANHPLALPTMIWNTGKIIFELMNQTCIDASSSTGIFTFSPSTRFVKHRFRYWPELETLVRQCLLPNPDERPHLNDVLYRTRVGLADWEKSAMSVDGAHVPAPMTWGFEDDEFAMGTKVPRHWWWAKGWDEEEDGVDASEDDDEGETEKHTEEKDQDRGTDGVGEQAATVQDKRAKRSAKRKVGAEKAIAPPKKRARPDEGVGGRKKRPRRGKDPPEFSPLH
ncbi:hypothetical protein ACEQ8H_002755 [Pleosporales sp. CAS-2024a]